MSVTIATSNRSNLTTSRYIDFRDKPISRLLAPITAYEDASQVVLEESIKAVPHLFKRIGGNVWVAKENSKNPANDLTQNEPASIQLYTRQFHSEPCLYQVLNRAICDKNRQSLRPWNGSGQK